MKIGCLLVSLDASGVGSSSCWVGWLGQCLVVSIKDRACTKSQLGRFELAVSLWKCPVCVVCDQSGRTVRRKMADCNPLLLVIKSAAYVCAYG